MVNKHYRFLLFRVIIELMNDSRINLATITGQITAQILKLLDENPEGLRWKELLAKIKESNTSFHPKTINGCIWKITDKFPDKVYKPSKGMFRLTKYK